MYSGETESDEEEPQGYSPRLDPIDAAEAEFLRKLNSLKVDCVQLHKTLENALKTSGVCKKYTGASSKISTKTHRQALSEIQNLESPRKRKNILYPKKKIKVENKTSPRRPSKLQNYLLLEKRKRELRRYQQKRKELSERPHLIPLRPKSASIRPIIRRNGNSRYSWSMKLKSAKRKQRKSIPWFPRRTVPEPFLFTLREEITPIRATYSHKFLEQMLQEKKKKEEQELSRLRRQFVANPIPETTYVSNSNFYVGRLKKPKSKDKFPPSLKLSRIRSQSEPTLSGRTPFKANPVPLSTYVRPSSTADEERAQKKAQRAMELLLLAREPFGMSDHSIRSHIQYRIRHLPTCYEPKPTFKPNITKSVPDFRLLQREFTNRLQEARDTRPPTVTEPFRFHNEGVSKHFCENMKVKPTVVKFKNGDFESGRLKTSQRNKGSSRTMSSLSSATLND